MRSRRTLFRRAAFTVAAGLVVFQVAAGFAVYAYVLAPLAQRSADDLAGFLVMSARTWAELPPETRPAFAAELEESHHIALTDAPDRHDEEVRRHPYMNRLREALERRLDPPEEPRIAVLGDGRYHVDIAMGGHALHFTFANDLLPAGPVVALAWIVAAGLAVTLATAWLLARRVTAPVAGLADAARQIGRGEHPGRLDESGDREIAGLARAFNEAAERLAAERAHQAALLAGVSHDLRTPLARLAMALGMLAEERESPLVSRMEGDVAEMDALIGAQLALARAREGEQASEADIDALLAERVVAAEVLAPGRVSLRTGGRPCLARVPRVALTRIIANLVDNAIAHGGAGRVAIVRRCACGTLFVGVRDRGPGVPAALREAVFRPFYRLEPSRNRATGGSGLGLAIARQLAETHGWRLALRARRGGGTSAWLAVRLA